MENKEYRIVCPESSEHLIPAKVWHSKKPDGQRIVYGQFAKHHHNRTECEYTGHAVEAYEKK